MDSDPKAEQTTSKPAAERTPDDAGNPPARPPEQGGRKGPEPTRYGDWELNGRCIDF